MRYFAADTINHETQFLGKLLQNKHDLESLTCVSI